MYMFRDQISVSVNKLSLFLLLLRYMHHRRTSDCQHRVQAHAKIAIYFDVSDVVGGCGEQAR